MRAFCFSIIFPDKKRHFLPLIKWRGQSYTQILSLNGAMFWEGSFQKQVLHRAPFMAWSRQHRYRGGWNRPPNLHHRQLHAGAQGSLGGMVGFLFPLLCKGLGPLAVTWILGANKHAWGGRSPPPHFLLPFCSKHTSRSGSPPGGASGRTF